MEAFASIVYCSFQNLLVGLFACIKKKYFPEHSTVQIEGGIYTNMQKNNIIRLRLLNVNSFRTV